MITFANENQEGHRQVSVMDLKWPLFNFIILMIGIIFLGKKKISASFTKLSLDVEKLINYAQEKDREAQLKLEMFQRKIENFEQQKQKIDQETKQDLEKYETQIQLDFKNESLRRIKDAESKLENEKKLVLKKLYNELIDKVVENTKNKFLKDKNLKNKATEKILLQIR